MVKKAVFCDICGAICATADVKDDVFPETEDDVKVGDLRLVVLNDEKGIMCDICRACSSELASAIRRRLCQPLLRIGIPRIYERM